MAHVNFIPLARRQAARRRRHVRRWGLACGGYLVALLAVFGTTRVGGAGGHDMLQRTMNDLDTKAQQTQTRAVLVRDQLSRTQAELNASQAAAHQPDWSVLLSLLASSLGDDVVLRRCELWPWETRDPDSTEPLEARRLDLGGLGRTQQAVSRFVLRLERTGLFSTVTLLETQREPFLRDQAVAFRIECEFDTAGPAPAAGEGTTP